MSNWRAETASDLSDAYELMQSTLRSIKGEPTEDELMSIWKAYIRVEKSVAFIKFALGEENPGRFVKLKAYRVPDERQALQFALKGLRKGSDNFQLGDFTLALKDLRESRNYLRALLREKRLKRARSARRS